MGDYIITDEEVDAYLDEADREYKKRVELEDEHDYHADLLKIAGDEL